MQRSKSKSLSEKLAELANPTPSFADPEDDHHDAKAKIEDFDDEEVSGSTQKQLPSKRNLRQVNAASLGEVSQRYSGKRVSRKSLQDSDEGSEDDDGDEVSQSDDEMDGDLAAFRSKMKNKNMTNGAAEDSDEDQEVTDEDDEEDGEDVLSAFRSKLQPKTRTNGTTSTSDDEDGIEEEEDSYDDDDVDEDEEEEEEDGDDGASGEEDGIQQFSKKSEESELTKGRAVKAQISTWDQLLECRIKLQKGLNLSNQLPQGPENFKAFAEAAGSGFTTARNDAQKAAKTLIESLLDLQSVLLKKNTQTKNLLKRKAEKVEESDEEIPSDTEESGKETEEDDGEADHKTPVNKRQKTSDYNSEIRDRHDRFRSFRNQTLQLWNEKTRLATGRAFGKSKTNFSAFEQSVLKQIDHILADKQRLLKRTRTKRSAYKILGKSSEDIKTEKPARDVLADENVIEENTRSKDVDEEDPEIFDDDDFYHQLLRELIERRTADGGSDQLALGRQWLEIQKLRSKAKRNVDPKASKGRRLRFGIHSKLVSFMASHPVTSWSDTAKNELFASLFGGTSTK